MNEIKKIADRMAQMMRQYKAIDATSSVVPIKPDTANKHGIDLENRNFGERQIPRCIPAFEIPGFGENIHVYASLEKKQSRKKEERNDDTILVDPKTGLIGVFDGLGSSQGELASGIAEKIFPSEYVACLKRAKKLSEQEIIHQITDGLLAHIEHATQQTEINSIDIQKATQQAENIFSTDQVLAEKICALLHAYPAIEEKISWVQNEKNTDTKTTSCIGFIHTSPDDSRWLVMTNKGDSGAGIRHRDGNFEMITAEDSMLAYMLETKQINSDILQAMRAFPEKKETFLYEGRKIKLSYYYLKAMMSACIGDGTSSATVTVTELLPGDTVIIGTDGLWDKFEKKFSDETDLEKLSKLLGDETQTPEEKLNEVRMEAMFQKTAAKIEDDFGAVMITVA